LPDIYETVRYPSTTSESNQCITNNDINKLTLHKGNIIQRNANYQALRPRAEARRAMHQDRNVSGRARGHSGAAQPADRLLRMNVQELTSQANGTLFDFWQIGIPVLLVTSVCVLFIALSTMMYSDRPPAFK